ncbi:prophage MuMc02, structural protein P5 family protein [Prevotella sp. DNF00663]|nr:prophage MuMc02, structural protein P5 family protein [Prevotella sp. DNF00663]
MVSRGYRNCNPGNIRLSKTRYQGEIQPSADHAFKQFQSMPWGFRAMFVILRTYYNKYRLRTIRQIIHRWAPTAENDTEAYIRFVAKESGIGADEQVEFEASMMVKIVAAMAQMENGGIPSLSDITRGWYLL